MKIKILEFDLDTLTESFYFEDGYEYYRALIRVYKQPIGWISFVRLKGVDYISAEAVRKMVQKQLGYTVKPDALFYSNRHLAVSGKVEGITVIVCTRNRTEQLARCVQSLMMIDYQLYEVIIVDNAPDSDDTYELVKGLPVRYVREDRPGLDWARNCGITEAQYSIVAFTDDDTIVDSYWLKAIAKAFSNQEVMAASGYVAPAELNSYAEQVFELQYGGMGHGFSPRVLGKGQLNPRNLMWISNLAIGANMAFRKEVFDKVGGFDTAFDVGTPSRGGGDIEIFHRIVSCHYTVAYVPAMLIWHFHRKDFLALKKQISDNGRSFGCYLIHCYRSRTVSRTFLLRFFIVDWLIKWNLRNLLKRPSGIPRFFSLEELKGMVSSPYAYVKTKLYDRKLRRLSLVQISNAVGSN